MMNFRCKIRLSRNSYRPRHFKGETFILYYWLFFRLKDLLAATLWRHFRQLVFNRLQVPMTNSSLYRFRRYTFLRSVDPSRNFISLLDSGRMRYNNTIHLLYTVVFGPLQWRFMSVRIFSSQSLFLHHD